MVLTCGGTRGAFCDWEATVLFYAAVHLVDSKLAERGEHPRAHVEPPGSGRKGRTALVREHYPLIWGAYRALEELSRRARYDASVVLAERDVREARDRHYAAIRAMTAPPPIETEGRQASEP